FNRFENLNESIRCFEEFAQNGVRRETVTISDDGARRTLCAKRPFCISISILDGGSSAWRELSGGATGAR
ncbi:MAG: hypothetical protein ABI165_00250, partial [Bryobacteraceae bacterium]